MTTNSGTVFWPSGQRTVTLALANGVLRANELSIWLATQLGNLKIPNLPKDKPTQLSGACFHVAMEHHQAVVDLVGRGVYGSAMALQRPAVEACFRGLWLMLKATTQQLDPVGEDDKTAFPPFGQIVEAIEGNIGFENRQLSSLVTGRWWARLCSYTHTGYQQIGARLTPEGLGSGYRDDEMLAAMRAAGVSAVMAGGALAVLAENEPLGERIAAKLPALTAEP